MQPPKARTAKTEQSTAKTEQSTAETEQPTAKTEQPTAKAKQSTAKTEQSTAKTEQPRQETDSKEETQPKSLHVHIDQPRDKSMKFNYIALINKNLFVNTGLYIITAAGAVAFACHLFSTMPATNRCIAIAAILAIGISFLAWTLTYAMMIRRFYQGLKEMIKIYLSPQPAYSEELLLSMNRISIQFYWWLCGFIFLMLTIGFFYKIAVFLSAAACGR